MTLWSNPNPSDATAAMIASRAHVDSPGIGGVLSAILADRYRKQQEFQNTLAQVGQAIKDYRGQQDAGALADYIQGGYQGDMSAMSPEARLKALQLAQAEKDAQDKMKMEQALNDARVNYYNNRSIPTPRAVPFSGDGEKPMTAGQQAVQDRFNERLKRSDLDKQIQALNDTVKSYGYSPDILTSTTAVHKGTDLTGQPVPDGLYRLDMPDKTTKDVPMSAFDAAHNALDHYRTLLRQRAAMDAQSSPSVPQGAIYDPRTTRAGQLNPGAELPAPDLPPDGGTAGGGGGIPLDAATAQDFLQRAGGDKDKARALARAAGYVF